MTPNNNLSILPVYTSLDQQFHRRDYSLGQVFPLYVSNNYLIPFQFSRPTTAHTISEIEMDMYNLDDELVVGDALEGAPSDHFRIDVSAASTLGIDTILFYSTHLLGSAPPKGQYYAKIYDGLNYYYTEVFTVVDDVSEFLKITYYDSANLVFTDGQVSYNNNFKFWVYLPTQLGMPEYPYTEEVQERDGRTFYESQISEKTFKFNFLAPEFLLDAMRLIRLTDSVEVYSRGNTYTVEKFLITPKWEDGGYLASVEAEFQCDTILKKIGKAS